MKTKGRRQSSNISDTRRQPYKPETAFGMVGRVAKSVAFNARADLQKAFGPPKMGKKFVEGMEKRRGSKPAPSARNRVSTRKK